MHIWTGILKIDHLTTAVPVEADELVLDLYRRLLDVEKATGFPPQPVRVRHNVRLKTPCVVAIFFPCYCCTKRFTTDAKASACAVLPLERPPEVKLCARQKLRNFDFL